MRKSRKEPSLLVVTPRFSFNLCFFSSNFLDLLRTKTNISTTNMKLRHNNLPNCPFHCKFIVFFSSYRCRNYGRANIYPCGNSPAFDPKSVWRSTLILFCDSHAANEEYRILHFLVLRSLFFVWTSAFVLQVSNVPNFQSDSLPEAPYSLLLTSSHFLRLISTISIFLSNSSGDTCSIIVQG